MEKLGGGGEGDCRGKGHWEKESGMSKEPGGRKQELLGIVR